MSRIENSIDYIEFPTSSREQLNRTKTFFGEVFGWSFQQWGDDYADTKDSGVGSGISADNPTKAPLPVVYVSDIDATYENLRKVGGVITKEIFSFPGGRRFHFKDPADNELAVWSE